MHRSFWLILSLVGAAVLSGCSQPDGESDFVKNSCAEARTIACNPDCQGGVFRECWVDPALVGDGKLEWRKHCHGIHVGQRCAPCREIFSVNGGGSFREVSCEYFFNSIEKQNKECGRCLRVLTDFEYEESRE